MKNYYECFSEKLYHYLSLKGFKYVNTYVHNSTNVTCYVYKITPELSAALKSWTKTNPNKKSA